jgi:hypothetical protein
MAIRRHDATISFACTSTSRLEGHTTLSGLERWRFRCLPQQKQLKRWLKEKARRLGDAEEEHLNSTPDALDDPWWHCPLPFVKCTGHVVKVNTVIVDEFEAGFE